MQVRIIVGAAAAYACIKGDTYSMDWRLEPGRSAQTSLRESAHELSAKADRLQQQAKRLLDAADQLQREGCTFNE